MSHMGFQSAVTPKPFSPLKPCLPIPRPLPSSLQCKLRRSVVKASSSSSCPPVDAAGESISALERCFMLPSSRGELGPSSSGSCSAASAGAQMGPVMKGKFGSFGAVTLEKGKLDLTQKKAESSPELAVGGGGGDIGKKINYGGGDGGDDDDYFDEFDDDVDGDEGGLFRRRQFLAELFDRKFVDADTERVAEICLVVGTMSFLWKYISV